MGTPPSAAPTLVYLASNTCLNSSRSSAEFFQRSLLQRLDGYERERFRFGHGMIRHAVYRQIEFGRRAHMLLLFGSVETAVPSLKLAAKEAADRSAPAG